MNTKVSKKKRWKDFSSGQRAAIVALASVQVALAGTAWIDLARRDASEVNGSKGKWAAIIAVDFVGPILYFTRGVRR